MRGQEAGTGPRRTDLGDQTDADGIFNAFSYSSEIRVLECQTPKNFFWRVLSVTANLIGDAARATDACRLLRRKNRPVLTADNCVEAILKRNDTIDGCKHESAT